MKAIGVILVVVAVAAISIAKASSGAPKAYQSRMEAAIEAASK